MEGHKLYRFLYLSVIPFLKWGNCIIKIRNFSKITQVKKRNLVLASYIINLVLFAFQFPIPFFTVDTDRLCWCPLLSWAEHSHFWFSFLFFRVLESLRVSLSPEKTWSTRKRKKIWGHSWLLQSWSSVCHSVVGTKGHSALWQLEKYNKSFILVWEVTLLQDAWGGKRQWNTQKGTGELLLSVSLWHYVY